MNDAITTLQLSLTSSWWINSITLVTKTGENVFKAEKEGVVYALKTPKYFNPENRERINTDYRREGAILGKINHEGLVKVVSVESHNQFPYMVMEFLDGSRLTDTLTLGAAPADKAKNRMKKIVFCISLA